MKASWPFDPLEPFIGSMSEVEAAEFLGVSRRQLRRYRWEGVRMYSDTADRAALRLGLHPANIWVDW